MQSEPSQFSEVFRAGADLASLAEKLVTDESARCAFREDPQFFLKAHGIHLDGSELQSLFGILGKRGI